MWVANAAGNDGPDEATLGDPAVAPWLNVVASSTHDVVYRNSVTFSGPVEGLEELHGRGLSSGYGPAPVVYAGDYGDPLCEGDFDAEFDGEIVICDRGEVARVDKSLHVLENGGGGMIHAEVDEGDSSALANDAHWLPATHLSQPDSDRLKQWLQESQAKGEELMATLSGTYTLSDQKAADVISAFSSRGYNEAVPSLIKPDMAAPGSSIFAPVVDGLGYAIYQGTSMASPHVAGVLALLKARHPHWSPAQAQSALMTTSETDIRRNAAGDPATPFDMGAGRVDAWNAMHAALVLDESGEGYRDANPELYWTTPDRDKGDPAKINMPSLGQGACLGECSWTRTLSNASSHTTSWDVSVAADTGLSLDIYPQSFTLAPGQSQVLEVHADCSSVALQEWAFGRVMLQERQDLVPDTHLPVAVRALQYHTPETWEIETAQLQGSETLYRLQGTDVSEIAAWGL
ncbi:MAG: S8 family serine peptidase, partial [Desulfuromonadaceae bacterium]